MSELAEFVDRFTMRQVRTYPHPIERVWKALTDPVEISAWFLPAKVDLRVGGEFAFGAAEPYIVGQIERVDPPRLIQFGYGGSRADTRPTGAFMRFELEKVAAGTRMTFIHHFVPGITYDEVPNDLGGDLPAGIGTPWRPGFVGGWHLFFDALGRRISGEPVLPDPQPSLFNQLVAEWLKRKLHEHQFDRPTCDAYARELASIEEWNRYNQIYREYIRSNIPPA